jgi:hypothetical protein
MSLTTAAVIHAVTEINLYKDLIGKKVISFVQLRASYTF